MMQQKERSMLTLANLRHEMEARAISAPVLSRLTSPVTADRISVLSSKNDLRREEPWLWEAHTVARALGIDDIMTLIGRRMFEIVGDIDEELQDDLAIWNTGCELPLRVGIRISHALGLRDPMDLFDLILLRRRNPALVEAWTIAASGERSGAPCPWCLSAIVGDAGHLPTCLVNNLWGTRAVDPAIVFQGAGVPEPHRPGKRQHGKGRRAPGLRAVRRKLCITQANMADRLGISFGHYSKIEACKAAFTPENLIRLRQAFPHITRADVLTAPVRAAEVSTGDRVAAPPGLVADTVVY